MRGRGVCNELIDPFPPLLSPSEHIQHKQIYTYDMDINEERLHHPENDPAYMGLKVNEGVVAQPMINPNFRRVARRTYTVDEFVAGILASDITESGRYARGEQPPRASGYRPADYRALPALLG